jgi:hypothetical protein
VDMEVWVTGVLPEGQEWEITSLGQPFQVHRVSSGWARGRKAVGADQGPRDTGRGGRAGGQAQGQGGQAGAGGRTAAMPPPPPRLVTSPPAPKPKPKPKPSPPSGPTSVSKPPPDPKPQGAALPAPAAPVAVAQGGEAEGPPQAQRRGALAPASPERTGAPRAPELQGQDPPPTLPEPVVNKARTRAPGAGRIEQIQRTIRATWEMGRAGPSASSQDACPARDSPPHTPRTPSPPSTPGTPPFQPSPGALAPPAPQQAAGQDRLSEKRVRPSGSPGGSPGMLRGRSRSKGASGRVIPMREVSPDTPTEEPMEAEGAHPEQ